MSLLKTSCLAQTRCYFLAERIASSITKGNIAIRDGGFAALLAPQIINNGTITARLGTVALAASQSVSVDFYGDGLLRFSADSALQSAVMTARL